MSAQKNIKAYHQMDIQPHVVQAEPHKLIQMLLEGALQKLSLARGHMQHGNLEGKGLQLSWAINIINGLKISLDFEKGGDIAQNLSDLYTYMESRILEANRNNSVEIIDEVSGLLLEIKEGWDNMPDEFISKHS